MKKPEQKFSIKLLEFFGSAILVYMLINLLLNYVIRFASFGRTAKEFGITLSEHLAFKVKYLFLPPPTMDIKIVLIFSLTAGLLIYAKCEQHYKIKHGNKYVKGDDHFLTPKEISKDTTLYSFSADKPEEATQSGLPIALVDNRMYISPETTHSMIVGTTRSGKGQTYVLPMIRYIAMSQAKHSIVANDPKGELLENLYDVLISNGYKVLVLNLRDTNLSSLWNPLQIIIDEYVRARKTDGDLSKTIKLITSLSAMFTDNPKSDPIWPDSARALLVSMILYLLEKGYEEGEIEKVTMYSVYNLFIEFGTKDEAVVANGVKKLVNMLDSLFQSLPIGNPAKSAYATSNFAKGEMRSSIFSTLSSNINIFGTDTGISMLTSGNQIDFKDLINPEKPCAIFMVVPDEDVSRHVISSLFVNQCYNSLVEESSKFPMQKLPQRVHFILDEFGNMPRIPAMDTKITVGAGRNLLFNLFVQDLNQLDTKYDNASKTIRSNCGNFVYINSLDKDTNEYVSALLGNETISYDTYSGALNEWLKNRNINVDSRPLMTATQLGRMKFGETVVKRQRSDPIHTKFTPFYKLNIPVTSIVDIPIELQHRSLEDTIYNFSDLWVLLGRQITPTGDIIPIEPEALAEYQSRHDTALEIENLRDSDEEINHHEEVETTERIEVAEDDSLPKTKKESDNSNILTSSAALKKACKVMISKCPEFKEAQSTNNFELCKELILKQKRCRRISEEDSELLLSALSQVT